MGGFETNWIIFTVFVNAESCDESLVKDKICHTDD